MSGRIGRPRHQEATEMAPKKGAAKPKKDTSATNKAADALFKKIDKDEHGGGLTVPQGPACATAISAVPC